MLSLFPWLYWWGRNIFLLAVIDLLDIAPIGSLIGGRINCWKEKSDPSLVATVGMLFAVLVFIAGLIGSGFSSYA